MADIPETQAPVADAPTDGRRRLTRRVAVVGLTAAPMLGASLISGQNLFYDPADRKDLPSPDVSPQAAAANPGAIAASKGLVFGSCVNGGFAGDERYRAVTLRYSNTIIPGAATQWMNVQSQPGGAYDFGLAEQICSWAKAAGRAVRSHAIIDWTYLPEWLPARVAEASVKDAEEIFSRHVQTMANYWRGRFIDRMVVNEACINTGLNPMSIWANKLGEKYIDLAFHLTHQGDPTTRLMINESETEMDNRYQRAKLDSFHSLITRLKTRGVPIGSIGIQGHLKSDAPVNQKGLEAFMKELAAMGLPFMITELDVDDRGLPDNPRTRDACVAAIMRDLLDVALEQPHCEGVQVWDFSDHDNWLVQDPKRRRRSGGNQRPAVLDSNYKPKASWAILVDCLNRARGPARDAKILPPTRLG